MACVTLLSARAQLFSPESIGGAFWGSLIGRIAGGDCHHGFSGQGAAIGAGVGLLAGALVGEARRQDYYNPSPVVYAPAPMASVGYGYGPGGPSPYVYYTPNAYSAPGYYYRPTRPNYAVGGTLLGAASGALIGEGASGKPGGGAAIGAGVGLLAGALVGEARRQDYYNSQPVVYAPAPTASVGYGYGPGGPPPDVYYTPNAYAAPGYYYRPTRPNYAVGGTLLGAASGALIGEGASGKPGGGAAIGAATGLVLGSIAEHTARKQEQRFASAQPTVPYQVQQPAPPAPTEDARLQTRDPKSLRDLPRPQRIIGPRLRRKSPTRRACRTRRDFNYP